MEEHDISELLGSLVLMSPTLVNRGSCAQIRQLCFRKTDRVKQRHHSQLQKKFLCCTSCRLSLPTPNLKPLVDEAVSLRRNGGDGDQQQPSVCE